MKNIDNSNSTITYLNATNGDVSFGAFADADGSGSPFASGSIDAHASGNLTTSGQDTFSFVIDADEDINTDAFDGDTFVTLAIFAQTNES